jgi:hypothetical protein
MNVVTGVSSAFELWFQIYLMLGFGEYLQSTQVLHIACSCC